MLQKIETFFSANKVFFLGLLGAIGMTLQQILSTTTNWGVIGFAVVIAGLSYAAKTLTGKLASLIGVLGSSIVTISTIATGGHVDIQQLVISTLAAVALVVSGGATSTKTT